MISISLLVITLITLLIVHYVKPILQWFKSIRRQNRMFQTIPGPDGYPIIGNIHLFYDVGQYGAWERLRKPYAERYNYDLWKVWGFGQYSVNVLEPKYAEALMMSNKHTNKAFIYRFLEPWLGTGLLTSKGIKWQSRRKILTPSFHFNILQNYTKSFDRHSDLTVNELKNEVEKPYTIPVNIVTEYTLRALCETTMGLEINSTSKRIDEYKRAIFEFGEFNLHRVFRVWLYIDSVYFSTRRGRQVRKIIDKLHQFTRNVIHQRLTTWSEAVVDSNHNRKKRRMAMLDLLISQMKSGEDIDLDGICEEVDTFMFEGHDTTASALTFVLLCLANYHTVQERVFDEVNDILKHNTDVTIDDLGKMTYLDMVIKESLRLYPPVHFISRALTEDLDLRKHVLPAGSMVNIHIFDIHRNPNYWPEPERFDPERFSVSNSIGRHPFSYIPFSAGMRNCIGDGVYHEIDMLIGQRFAMLEMKMLVSKIVRKYRLEPVTLVDDVRFMIDLILRAERDIRVKFVKRG